MTTLIQQIESAAHEFNQTHYDGVGQRVVDAAQRLIAALERDRGVAEAAAEVRDVARRAGCVVLQDIADSLS